MPHASGFIPVEMDTPLQGITLTVDEYESIRLIDREGLSQEECGQRMEIARATVQQIYAGARKKLADMLVEGLPESGYIFKDGACSLGCSLCECGLFQKIQICVV